MKAQGRELRGQENLKWNTESIGTMELENMMSQAAHLDDGEHATNLEKLTLTNACGRITFPREWTREHQFIKERLES